MSHLRPRVVPIHLFRSSSFPSSRNTILSFPKILPAARIIHSQAVPVADQQARTKAARSFFRRPGLLLGLAALPLITSPLWLDSQDPSNIHPPTLTTLTNRDLIRSYLVYTICSFPTLVELGPRIIDWCYATRIPGVKWAMEKIVRITFFEQFAGSDTLEGSVPIVERLAARGVGTLFAYSVEADQASVAELSHDDESVNSGSTTSPASASSLLNQELVKANLRSVEFASQMNIASGADTAVAIKVSGLLKDPAVLIRLSSAVLPRQMFTSHSYIALTEPNILEKVQQSLSISDRRALSELVDVFRKVGQIAEAGKVKVIIDAEQSWLQPAIDVIFLAVARELRNPRSSTSNSSTSSRSPPSLPTFYMTLQTSLKRSQPLLHALLDDAQTHNWPLGVKLVRGAYVDQEHKAAASIDCVTAAWESKQETDVCYNTCATILVDGVAANVDPSFDSGKVPSIGAMFASHNRHSVALVVELMRTKGLVRTAAGPGSDKSDETLILDKGASSRISFGQLYGMADDITDGLGRHLLTADGTKAVYKYLPYGPLDRVLPYLVRRAKENKSIMAAGSGGGGAYEEKKRLRAEANRRVKGWWRGEEDVIRSSAS